MPDAGTLLKYLHILAAMIYVSGYIGAAALQIASGRASDWTARQTLMRSANLASTRLLVPGFIAAGALGVVTALVMGHPLHTGWVRNALVLYVVMLVTGIVYWTPLGKKQEAAAIARDEGTFRRLADRRATRFVGLFDVAVLLLLIYLMVARPP